MGTVGGPGLIKDGLVFYLDVANYKSYTNGSTKWIDLIGDNSPDLTNGTGYDPGNKGSITFDGVNDYVQLPEKLFAGAEDFSMSVTFKNTNENYTFYGGPLYSEWTTGAGTDNNATIYLYQGTSPESTTPYNIQFTCQINDVRYTIESNRVVQLNKIVNVTITRSGTDVKLYFNGQLDASGIVSSDPIDDKTNNPLIGNTGYGADYKGNIYNIFKYNRRLTASEVAVNYNSIRERINIRLPEPGSEFIMLVKTDNTGTSNNDQFTIPTLDTVYTYNYTVDWGDGTTDTGLTGSTTHTFIGGAGTYTVKISGEFPMIYFNFGSNDGGDRLKLLEIQNWGDNVWEDFAWSFAGCENMDITATDTPIIGPDVSMYAMFYTCRSLIGNSSFNNWNTSNVTSMSFMFRRCDLFNQPIGNWDLSNVSTTSYMFYDAINFTGDISAWNMSNVTTLQYMFDGATNFNSDISSWNTSNVTNTAFMLRDAISFDQDLGAWDTSNVINMIGMFYNAKAFNNGGSASIGNWNTSNITQMRQIFYGASSFNQDIGAWDTSNVTTMLQFFFQATAFNNGGSASIGNWNTSNVTSLQQTFREATNFNQDISSWDVSNVTTMFECFGHVTVTPNSFNQNLSAWQLRTSGVNLRTIFYRSSMSTANYTDTIVSWANQVFINGGPLNVDMALQNNRIYDTSRSGGVNFATAGDARTYLTTTAGWTIAGDTVI